MKKPVHTLTAHDTAIGFLCLHADEHLNGNDDQLLERTANHLVEKHDISRESAITITGQAYAEHTAAGCSEYIDLSRTTAHCVFICMPNGEDRCITASKLAALSI